MLRSFEEAVKMPLTKDSTFKQSMGWKALGITRFIAWLITLQASLKGAHILLCIKK